MSKQPESRPVPTFPTSQTAISRDRTPDKRPNMRQRALRTGAAIGVVIGGVGGWVAARGTASSPSHNTYCAVAASTGNTLNGLASTLGSHDTVPKVFAMPKNVLRTPENTPDYYVSGSEGLRAGDAVVFDDVPLEMCIAEGGVPEVTPDGNLQAAQRKL